MTIEAASRIYKATAKKHQGKIPPRSFAAIAMSKAMKNELHLPKPKEK